MIIQITIWINITICKKYWLIVCYHLKDGMITSKINNKCMRINMMMRNNRMLRKVKKTRYRMRNTSKILCKLANLINLDIQIKIVIAIKNNRQIIEIIIITQISIIILTIITFILVKNRNYIQK